MKKTKTIVALVLCVMFVMLMAFSVSSAEIEYVIFGIYPQSEVAQTVELEAANYDENGDTVIGDAKYRRVISQEGTRYFIYEPIVWQKIGSTLVALDVLECKMYDEQEQKIKDFMGGVKYAEAVTWEECSVRSWLNNEFASIAFTESERARLSDEVRLMTLAEARTMDKSQLCKKATEYAVSSGIELKNTECAEWFLKDFSPVTKSAICTVKNDGIVNDGISVIVNDDGIGIVPCMTLNSFSGLTSYSGKAPEKTVELYYPGGRTVELPENQVSSALTNGWFTDKADAMNENALAMKARFAASELNSLYDWRLYNASGRAPYISIDAEKQNMTPKEAIEFIKPIMDTFYTGNLNDYMEVHVEFVYGKEMAASFSEFSSTVGESIHDAIEACWSGWGNIICSDGGSGRLTGTSGAQYTATVRLKINGDGVYSIGKTNYNKTLHTLALEAKAYSSRPLGQIQYLRNYYGQNTIYDGRQFNNEPNSLITNGVGICGTYANFTADFCKLLGIPCIIYTNDKAMHAWNGVYIEGEWYHMDHTGTSDKEYMRNFYSNYTVDGETYSFDSDGFPDEHTAKNVSFLGDSYLPVDNLSEADISYVKELFASDKNSVTANPSISETVAPQQQQKEITVLLKGEKLTFDVSPIIENGRTLVPMRKIFESLGATVYWNGDTLTATGVRDVTVVSITVNSLIMTKNGGNISLDVPARLIDSRTLVPVRVIAESFGLEVLWDDVNYTVIIN